MRLLSYATTFHIPGTSLGCCECAALIGRCGQPGRVETR